MTTTKSRASVNPANLRSRIFVNRNLNLESVRAFGFDMDYTLVPYIRERFEALAFRATLDKFLEAGYPPELEQLSYKPGFIIRGLLVDRDRGNILKVDSHKYVKTAYHGYTCLSKDERHRVYNKQSYDADDFVSVDTHFSLSEVQLFVEIVNFMRCHPGRIAKSFREIYHDIRWFIDLCHQDGSIKNDVMANPEHYVICDKHLPEALAHLADAGRRLFLLTNSDYAYTDAMMDYVLSGKLAGFSRWRSYWDVVIVGAAKPSFFSGTQPFFEIADEQRHLLRVHRGPLAQGAVYFGGNAKDFQHLVGHSGDEILYVGDHIYGDIIRSKEWVNWRTMLVIKEMEEQLSLRGEAAAVESEIATLRDRKDFIDLDLQRIRRRSARGRQRQAPGQQDGLTSHHQRLEQYKLELARIEEDIRQLYQRRAAIFHPQWGELMRVGTERSRFADQVSSYACLYTAKVSNLRYYSPYTRLVSHYDAMPHER